MADAARGAAEVAAPAGTGNAPGLGEAFALDLNTGQGGYSVPIPLPDGVAGFSPAIKLEYHHGGGPGPFGLGWALPLRSIELRLDYGVPGSITPVYTDGDRELVDIGGGEYRARRESDFTRYRRDGDGWQVIERTGIFHRLGAHPETRIADPDHPDRVLTWLLESSTDTCGNEIGYTWIIDGSTPYLASAGYAIYTVRLTYADRPDVRRSGRSGFARTLARRCTEIALHVADPGAGGADTPVRRWSLGYRQAAFSGASLLTSVRLTSLGHGLPDVVRPPQTFGYSEPDPSTWHAAFMAGTAGTTGTAPPPITDPTVVLAPLGDGPATGVLQVQGGRFTYWPPTGDGSFDAPRRLDRTPIVGDLRSDRVQLLDVDGDTLLDMIVGGPPGTVPTGFYRGDGHGGLGEYLAYPRTRRSTPLDGSAPARPADLDGDGRIDMLTGVGNGIAWWRNAGDDGWADPQPVRIADDPGAGGIDVPPPDLADPLVRLADLTGDGLPDLVRIRSGSVTYWPNLGLGRFGPAVIMAGSPRLPASQAPGSLLLADLDGDGCADLVRVDGTGVTIWPNRGGVGFGDPIADPLVPAPIPGTLAAAITTDDGAAGLLWCSRRSGGTGYVRYDVSAAGYQLTGVDNGAGLHSEIDYTTAAAEQRRDAGAGRLWARPLPFPLVAVASTREVDTITGRVAESRYRYHDAYYDDRMRTFQGFAQVEKIEVGDGSRPDGRTVYTFRVGEDRLPGNGPEHAALNRMLRRIELFADDGTDDAGSPYTTEESDHAVAVLGTDPDGRQRVFVTVTESTKSICERTGDTRVEGHRYGYDDVGNVVTDEQRCSGTLDGAAQPEIVVVTEVAYATDPDANILDRISRVTRRDGAGGLLQEIHRRYDGEDFVGLPLGAVQRGNQTSETRWVMTRDDFDTHYAGMDLEELGYQTDVDADGRPGVFAPADRRAYDAAGRQVGSLSPTGSRTTITYDATGLFRARQENPLGTTVSTFDVLTGKPMRIDGADAVTVLLRHDPQGRLLAVALPGDTIDRPTRSYAYDDSALPAVVTVTHRLASATDQVGTIRLYYDGHGTEAQRRVQMDTGRFVVSGHAERNPWGDAATEYEPTFDTTAGYAVPDPDGRPSRRVSYDVLGRPVRTVDYGGGVSTATYTPFSMTMADADDNDAAPEAAARGQAGTVRVDHLDAAGHRILTVEQGGAGPVRTTFTPDALGRFVAHADDLGEVQRSTFDALGNRLTTHHRDAGDRKLFYDAGNRVVRVVDGAANDVAAAFDAADRITTLSVGGAVRESYGYDDAASNGLGKLHRVSYPGGSQTFGYDATGRRSTHTYAFDGVADEYTYRFGYDPQGRRTSVTYPDGSTLTQEYYANGVPRSVPGYVTSIDYDPRMMLSHIMFDNGVSTTVDLTPGTGRVAGQRTVGPGDPAPTVLSEVTYGYDPMWRLLSETEDTPGAAATTGYDYDPLYQLTAVHRQAGDGAPVTTGYAYANGRQISANGESGLTLLYGDAAHPGRVSHLTGAGIDIDVGYDGNGAMTALPDRTLTFGPKGELQAVTRADGTAITYTYDHSGARIRKLVRRGAGAADTTDTLFLGALGEVRNGVLARYVVVGSSRLAVVHNGATNWIHTDPLGSATFYTDAVGTKISRIAYRAFGNADVGPAAPWAQVFALHEFDSDAGLYYMRKRWYASDLGCFVSPDAVYLLRPERGVDTPAALALYSYANNDPTNNVDPDGGSVWSVLGGIVGVVVGVVVGVLVIAAFASGVGWAILAIAGVVALVTGGYLLAATNQGSGFGEFMKGFLIGFNAGMNFTLATFLGFLFGVAALGFGIGLGVGILGFLATIDTVRQNSVYQGILGWSNWLMPMSWVVLVLGAAFFVLNVLGWLFTAGQVDALKITYVHMDWSTGSIVMKGGWISNLNAYHTAFDMGNFVFVDRQNTAPDDDVPHETGHSLSLGAFGSVVHLVGFVDEFVVNGGSAWTEKMADSHAGKGPDTTWNH